MPVLGTKFTTEGSLPLLQRVFITNLKRLSIFRLLLAKKALGFQMVPEKWPQKKRNSGKALEAGGVGGAGGGWSCCARCCVWGVLGAGSGEREFSWVANICLSSDASVICLRIAFSGLLLGGGAVV